MIVEEIIESDLNEMVDIYISAFNGEPWNELWTIEIARKRLESMIKDSGFYGIKIASEGKIKAFILGYEEQYYNGKIFNIKELCVHRDEQGKRYGEKIILEFEKKLRNKNIKEAILMTIRHTKMENFYNRNGYTEDEKLVIRGKNLIV